MVYIIYIYMYIYTHIYMVSSLDYGLFLIRDIRGGTL